MDLQWFSEWRVDELPPPPFAGFKMLEQVQADASHMHVGHVAKKFAMAARRPPANAACRTALEYHNQSRRAERVAPWPLHRTHLRRSG